MNSDQLAAWLVDAVPQWSDQSIGPITELASGWESDVYEFLFTHASGVERLVLRLYAGADGSLKADREFTGMALLHTAGYPVPKVIAVEPDPAPLGRPFMVMEWADGNPDRPWSQALGSSELPGFVELLTRLHGLDWRPFAASSRHAALAAGRGVEQDLGFWDHALASYPSPPFLHLMAWLRDQLAGLPHADPAVVHWDFHVGNVLRTDDGEATVVDWTQIAVTDPRLDVAWTELLVGMALGAVPAAEFRAEYERQAGPLEGMGFFQVAAAVKRLFSVIISLYAGPEALGMRAEAADRMRADAHTLQLPYRTVRRHTGIRIPEVEDLLGDNGP